MNGVLGKTLAHGVLTEPKDGQAAVPRAGATGHRFTEGENVAGGKAIELRGRGGPWRVIEKL